MHVSLPKNMKFDITIRKMEENNDSYYLAECKQLPGFLVEGDTITDIYTNISIVFPDFVKLELAHAQKKQDSKAKKYEITRNVQHKNILQLH